MPRRARKLAREGARVFVADRDAAKGEEVVAAIRRAGGGADFVQLDLIDEAPIARCAAAVAESARALHALVNNAGIYRRRPSARSTAAAGPQGRGSRRSARI